MFSSRRAARRARCEQCCCGANPRAGRARAIATAILSALLVGLSAAIAAITAAELSSSSDPKSRCLMGGDPRSPHACNATLAFAAIGGAGALVLLGVTIVDLVVDAVLDAAEGAATGLAGAPAAAPIRVWGCVRFVLGGWLTQVFIAGGVLLAAAWWAAALATVASAAAAADAAHRRGAPARHAVAAMTGAALGVQLGLVGLITCRACCILCCLPRRPGRHAVAPAAAVAGAGAGASHAPQQGAGPAATVAAAAATLLAASPLRMGRGGGDGSGGGGTAGGGGSVFSPAGGATNVPSRQQPLLPESVRMPAYPM